MYHTDEVLDRHDKAENRIGYCAHCEVERLEEKLNTAMRYASELQERLNVTEYKLQILELGLDTFKGEQKACEQLGEVKMRSVKNQRKNK